MSENSSEFTGKVKIKNAIQSAVRGSVAAVALVPGADLHPTILENHAIVVSSETLPQNQEKVMAQLQDFCYIAEGQSAELGTHYGESGAGITCTHQSRLGDFIISVIRPDTGDPYVTRVNASTGEREIFTGSHLAVDPRNQNITVFNSDATFSTYVSPRYTSPFDQPLPLPTIAEPMSPPQPTQPPPAEMVKVEESTEKPNRLERFTFSLKHTLSQVIDKLTPDRLADKPLETTTIGTITVPKINETESDPEPHVGHGCYSYSIDKEAFIATKQGDTMQYGDEESVCVASGSVSSRFNIWKDIKTGSLRFELFNLKTHTVQSTPLEPAFEGWVKITDTNNVPLLFNIETGAMSLDKPLVIESAGDAIFAGSYGIPCGLVGTLGQFCKANEMLDHVKIWTNWIATHNPDKQVIQTVFPVLKASTETGVAELIAEAKARTNNDDRWFVALTLEGGDEQTIKNQITNIMNQNSDNPNIGFMVDVEHFGRAVPISELNRINEYYANERIRLGQEGTGYVGVWYFMPQNMEFDEAYRTEFLGKKGEIIATAAPVFDGFGSNKDKRNGYRTMLDSFRARIGGVMGFDRRWGTTYDTENTDELFTQGSVDESVRIMAQQ